MLRLFTTCCAILLVVTGCRRSDPGVRLFDAAESGDLAAVRALVSQGAPINQQSPVKFGWTPLIGAVFHNNTNVVQFLVESGADVNVSDWNGETALMYALSRGDDALFVVQYLIDHGADIDAKDGAGVSAFEYARSSSCRPRIVDIFNAAREARARGPGDR